MSETVEFDPDVQCSGIFDRVERLTVEQRAHLFYKLECRWCWDCGKLQMDCKCPCSCGAPHGPHDCPVNRARDTYQPPLRSSEDMYRRWVDSRFGGDEPAAQEWLALQPDMDPYLGPEDWMRARAAAAPPEMPTARPPDSR